MFPRLGLRSRILVLTMPIVILVSAATAGIVYLSLGQVLEASARDIATSEASELRIDLTLHTIEDLSRPTRSTSVTGSPRSSTGPGRSS